MTGTPSKSADRKSTRLNSSHGSTSYAVFCLKKKKKRTPPIRRHTAPSEMSLSKVLTRRTEQSQSSSTVSLSASAPPLRSLFFFFFFNDTATPEIYPLSLHDALPICVRHDEPGIGVEPPEPVQDA